MVPTLVTRKCTGANGKASACVAAVMTTKSEEVTPYKIPSASMTWHHNHSHVST